MMTLFGSSGSMNPPRTARLCLEATARTPAGMSRKGPAGGEMVVIPCPGGAAHPEKGAKVVVKSAETPARKSGRANRAMREWPRRVSSRAGVPLQLGETSCVDRAVSVWGARRDLARETGLGLEITIRVPEGVDRTALFGVGERNLKMIRESLGVTVAARGDVVRIGGETDGVDSARVVVERLIEAAGRRRAPGRDEVLGMIARAGERASLQHVGGHPHVHGPAEVVRGNGESWGDRLDVYAGGRQIMARSANQKAYIESIQEHDLVITTGPAGTGKTYLAVAGAIHMLKTGRVKKAILARPAVEAGEKLGFLPGDQYAKVNPYLRPLLDALHDMLDYPTIKRFMAADIIEIVPLAFMRGRTLNDAIIILDEAQNTTKTQMQMFLTRMGQRSKMIVTGDTTQIDLPDVRESGLVDAVRRLRRTAGVGFCTLDRADVVRHALVQRIIDAYGEEPSGGHVA